MHHHTIDLVIILAFIVTIVVINRHFRWKRAQLWHETARLALEKGQSISECCPDTFGCGPGCGWRRQRWGAWCELRRGLVLIAFGTALFYALPEKSRLWAALPGFIGIANLLFALFSFLRSDKSPDSQDRDPSIKK